MAKLTEEEIKSITTLKEKFNQLVDSIGSVEVQLMSYSLQKEELKNQLQKMQSEEIKFAKSLEEKYGQGTISLETGEFTPKL
tara:strand:+ start:149 stop:394 length:246 start_codon:yes stop_codon:yes gene_type:complete